VADKPKEGECMMMTSPLSKIIGALVAATLLSACGGTISPSGTVADIPNRVREASMAANAKGPLAYVSGASLVSIYSYPHLKLVGQITGVVQPEGLCVDKAGDVWVADYGSQQMEEFAHGATKPKATLKLENYQSPHACSVDRKTGDLAVTAWRGGIGPGWLNIFKKAKGTATILTDSSFVYSDWVAYDSKGNLFIDGVTTNNKFEYAELKAGATKFTSVSLKHVSSPGGVQSDGNDIAVGDATAAKIYATSGKNVTRTTTLAAAGVAIDFFIDGGSVICACSQTIQIYKYPAGGTATLSIPAASGTAGVVVSK
jgi:NHL repeat